VRAGRQAGRQARLLLSTTPNKAPSALFIGCGPYPFANKLHDRQANAASLSLQLRILEAKPRAPSGRSLRQVAAGWLQQGADSLTPDQIEFTCVSEKQPTAQQLEDLKFAW
jgi:hypothetical protein